LFEMMCARPPFRANNHVELLRKIEERRDQIRFPEGIVKARAWGQDLREPLSVSALPAITAPTTIPRVSAG